VTPKSAADTLTTLILPIAIRPAHLLGKKWIAKVKVNGYSVVDREGEPVEGGALVEEDWIASPNGQEFYYQWNPFLNVHPYLITEERPTITLPNWSADLAKGQITFSTEITQTLGVSADNYVILALFGTFFSSALGSGWLFKVIRLFQPSKKNGLQDAESDEDAG
jgi:hypothetical protein